jgi:hypothetical protein
MSCYIIIDHTINRIYIFHTFALVFYFFHFSSIRSTICRYNLQSCHSSCSSPGQTSLGWKKDAFVGADGAPYCCRSRQNRIIWFHLFRAGASGSCSFCVRIYFGDSTRKLITSSTLNMKGGNSGNNGSDLDKGNIIKLTFNTLTEKDRKAFEAYRANFEEISLSRCEVMRHVTVLKDTMMIVFNKPKVIPKVRPDLSPSHNDI